MIGTRDQGIISQLISSFTRQNEDLVKQLFQLQYYFRGSMTRDDIYSMSYAERELAIEFINTRMEEARAAIAKGVSVYV